MRNDERIPNRDSKFKSNNIWPPSGPPKKLSKIGKIPSRQRRSAEPWSSTRWVLANVDGPYAWLERHVWKRSVTRGPCCTWGFWMVAFLLLSILSTQHLTKTCNSHFPGDMFDKFNIKICHGLQGKFSSFTPFSVFYNSVLLGTNFNSIYFGSKFYAQ